MDNFGSYDKKDKDCLIYSSCATILILLISLILYLTKYAPSEFVFSLALFSSLPLAFNLIFGYIFDKKSFSSWRKYSFLMFIIVLGLIYTYFFIPKSPSEGIVFILQFILGFLLASLIALIYSMAFSFFSNFSRNVKIVFSFMVTFLISSCLIFTLKYLGVINWVNQPW